MATVPQVQNLSTLYIKHAIYQCTYVLVKLSKCCIAAISLSSTVCNYMKEMVGGGLRVTIRAVVLAIICFIEGSGYYQILYLCNLINS